MTEMIKINLNDLSAEDKCQIPFDPESALEKYNFVRNKMAKAPIDSLPIGNGDVTANVWVEENLEKPIKTDQGYFSYRLSGRVIDVSTQHVKLGDFDFYLDVPFPKDIEEGMFISFDVLRIDTCFVH